MNRGLNPVTCLKQTTRMKGMRRPMFELFSSSSTESETTKHNLTHEESIVAACLVSAHKGNLSGDSEFEPSGKHRRQRRWWVIYDLLHLKLCQKRKKEKGIIMHDQQHSSSVRPHHTLNLVPLSSLFHLPFKSFIKSAFISLHHHRPMFSSILFSSPPCGIDFENEA